MQVKFTMILKIGYFKIIIFFNHKTIAKLKKKRRKKEKNKHTIDRFKIINDKDMRKMSNIVKNLIRRYVESRV